MPLRRPNLIFKKAIPMSQQNFAAMRSAMIASQLRTVGVNDQRVLAALETVARERFVPEARAASAYVDTAIPLGDGRALNTPLASARLVNEAKIMPSDHVLLIGAATGYLAAVLNQLAASVVAVESDAALCAVATRELAGLDRVILSGAALTEGAPAQAPYDVIVIDGAVEQLPQALIDQLKPGGRIATGHIDNGVTRLAVGHKSAGGFGLTAFADAACVVLTDFAKPKVFAFS
jgi:protein-L-isoaspartate(D-aspartate) O-methyltransferase